MAQDRTNMVSLLDIGTWLGGNSASIIEMGDGFNELTENWGAVFKDTQYVNMKNSASSVNGYAFTMTAEREYMSDDMQTAIDNAFKQFPTGTKAQTYYYRFYKSDLTESSGTFTGDCIRVPVVCAPQTTGGSAGETLVSAVELHGNGDAEMGTITISAQGTYTWAAKS